MFRSRPGEVHSGACHRHHREVKTIRSLSSRICYQTSLLQSHRTLSLSFRAFQILGLWNRDGGLWKKVYCWKGLKLLGRETTCNTAELGSQDFECSSSRPHIAHDSCVQHMCDWPRERSICDLGSPSPFGSEGDQEGLWFAEHPSQREQGGVAAPET